LGPMAKSKPNRAAEVGGWLRGVAWVSASLRVRCAARLGAGERSRAESRGGHCPPRYRGDRGRSQEGARSARRPARTPAPAPPITPSRLLVAGLNHDGQRRPGGSLSGDPSHFPVPVTTATAFPGFDLVIDPNGGRRPSRAPQKRRRPHQSELAGPQSRSRKAFPLPTRRIPNSRGTKRGMPGAITPKSQ
jgi:hypothetical protein